MKLRDLLLRARALMAPHRVERELDEELSFHIERETQKHIAAGLSSVDARMRALARFGPVPLAADGCRDARGTGFVDDVARDILYALRTFRRAPRAALTNRRYGGARPWTRDGGVRDHGLHAADAAQLAAALAWCREHPNNVRWCASMSA